MTMNFSHAPSRRGFLATAATSTLALAAGVSFAASPRTPVLVEVWKDPNCGCCGDWVKHLQSQGFQVKVNDTGNTAMRAKLGIDNKYGSCHTALVGGYAIEGHVPAREIRRLLAERPEALGLAVPGMPVGSPGMDGPAYGNRQDAYKVLLLTSGGGSRTYQDYPGKAQGVKA